MNLPKHKGPMTGEEAKSRIAATRDSLYVVAIASDGGPWYNQEWGRQYDLVSANGLVLHGFLQASDTILAITDWS